MNRVVREWFPMTDSAGPESGPVKTMLLLDVHIDDRKAGKFKAAFATLRIVPTWVRPPDDDAECPAPPQMIFVLQEPLPPTAFPIAPQPGGWAVPHTSGLYDQAFYPSVDVTALSRGAMP
jgi:hypothetical protein